MIPATSNRETTDLRLRPRRHWDRRNWISVPKLMRSDYEPTGARRGASRQNLTLQPKTDGISLRRDTFTVVELRASVTILNLLFVHNVRGWSNIGWNARVCTTGSSWFDVGRRGVILAKVCTGSLGVRRATRRIAWLVHKTRSSLSGLAVLPGPDATHLPSFSWLLSVNLKHCGRPVGKRSLELAQSWHRKCLCGWGG